MKSTHMPPATVDEYIAGFPTPVQTVLDRVRGAIRKALPGAAESISYRIPTYKLHGRPVLYFAGFKQHYSVYPANARLVAAFTRELAAYEYNNKGTIRFPLTKPVPAKLIESIAKFRSREVEDAFTAGPRKPSRGPSARRRTAARLRDVPSRGRG